MSWDGELMVREYKISAVQDKYLRLNILSDIELIISIIYLKIIERANFRSNH